MNTLSLTKYKNWVEPLSFIKLINELNTQLTESVDDLTLFLSIRNGESLRALEIERFNFSTTDLSEMIRKKEDTALAELNEAITGANVVYDQPNMKNLKDDVYKAAFLRTDKKKYTNKRDRMYKH